MPTTLTANRLATAVDQARHGRHHPHCVCGLYRDGDNAPYCSAEEFRWSEMVNRIITTVCRERAE